MNNKEDKERESQDNNPTPEIEGHPAAVRGSSATPGEAESRGAGVGFGEGLTDRIDEAGDDSEDGSEGRLGGDNYPGALDDYDGTEMDEFGEQGVHRRPIEDW